MSLISEALKKAQRMRTSEPVAGLSSGSGGGPISRRDHTRPTPPLAWIVAGAAVLVSVAVAVTVFFLRPAAPALSLAKAAAAPAAANTSTATLVATPAIPTPPKLPEVTPLKAEAAVPANGEAVVPPPRSATPASASVRPSPPPSRLPPSVPVPSVAGTAQPDPRIQAFVDAIKVAGIRSSGTESKVLMNDHVFRVNDIVDRSLNLRLIEVQADSLTFVDENSVVYRKSF